MIGTANPTDRVGNLELRVAGLESTLALSTGGIWIPVLRQNGAVVAGTTTGRYSFRDGLVRAYVLWTATAAGAAGTIDITLPSDRSAALNTSAASHGAGRFPGVGLTIWDGIAGDATRVQMRTIASVAVTTAIASGNVLIASLLYIPAGA